MIGRVARSGRRRWGFVLAGTTEERGKADEGRRTEKEIRGETTVVSEVAKVKNGRPPIRDARRRHTHRLFKEGAKAPARKRSSTGTTT
jgi:hypothetical protein